MPHRPFRPFTSRESTAPLAPAAPPITPVARPFLSAYHFWAQLMTAGYRNAHPIPTGRLNASANTAALPAGTAAPAAKPPASSAAPASPAGRGPNRSCRKPPSTQPSPNAPIIRLNTHSAPASFSRYSAATGSWNTPQAAGMPVRAWMAAPAAKIKTPRLDFFVNALTRFLPESMPRRGKFHTKSGPG